MAYSVKGGKGFENETDYYVLEYLCSIAIYSYWCNTFMAILQWSKRNLRGGPPSEVRCLLGGRNLTLKGSFIFARLSLKLFPCLLSYVAPSNVPLGQYNHYCICSFHLVLFVLVLYNLVFCFVDCILCHFIFTSYNHFQKLQKKKSEKKGTK